MMSREFRRPFVRSRGIPSFSSRRRYESEEEVVELDEHADPDVTLKNIIVHLVRQSDITKARQLAYLNVLVKFFKRFGHRDELPYTNAQIICCLKGCLLSKYRVIRAATLRCLRYYLDSSLRVELFFTFRLDWCVARLLDLYFSHDVERNQAIRLCRHIMHHHPAAMRPSLVLPFVAIANDGINNKERMVLTALQFLCELAYCNSEVFSQCGVAQIIMQHIIFCHDSPRVNECLTQTILYLLNTPKTRASCAPSCGLDQLVGPFTDAYYRHKNDKSEGSERKEERLLRCLACSQSLQIALHSWPGLVSLGNPQATGITSLMNSLQISTSATQKIILQTLYSVFLLRVPKWTDHFEEALSSCDPCGPSPTWYLREGFVAAECLSIFKAKCIRPNLIDNHLAILLSVFITNGVLETLCDVVIKAESNNSVWATILLGELLYMSYLLLPWSDCEHTHYLPTLVAASTSLTISKEQRLQANQAITYLDRIHSQKKRGKVPYSLNLQLIMSYIPNTAAKSQASSRKINLIDRFDTFTVQESEDDITDMIRDSLVLVELNPTNWNWSMISSALKCTGQSLNAVDAYSLNRFITKLLNFFNPNIDNGFSTIKLSDPNARIYTSVGLLLVEKVLLLDGDEAIGHLRSMLFDLCHCLSQISQEVPNADAKFNLSNMLSTCCQDYFLLIGKLSHTKEGMSLLESSGVLPKLLDIVTITTEETYVKLIVSCLDYTKDTFCRVILSKALTATSEEARLYAADFMRALLRLGVPFFSSWCMELLITQLYDQSKVVAIRSLSVINEACEEKANLMSLITVHPSVFHLGEMGSLLVTRYLSIMEGFKFLQASGYLERELDRWHEFFNEKYVDVVDTMLAESLSSYKTSYEDVIQRRTNVTRTRGESIYVPTHLYGQLVQHKEGTDVVANLPYLSEYIDIVVNRSSSNCENIKQSKAAIWMMGHIGSSVFGLPILDKQEVLPSLVELAECADVFTIRGAAFYALGLIASTQAGVARLAELGWRSVLNHRNEEWPILSTQLIYLDPEAIREMRSRTQSSSASVKSSGQDMMLEGDNSKFHDEGLRSRASTDVCVDDLIKMRNNERFQNSTSPLEPTKDGKAHSTSELRKSKPNHHERSKSETLDGWAPSSIPSLQVDNCKDRSTNALDDASDEVSDDFTDEHPSSVQNYQTIPKSSTPFKLLPPPKSAIKDISRTGIENNELGESKLRSLSWGKDVNLPESSGSGSPTESSDSAISQSPRSVGDGEPSILVNEEKERLAVPKKVERSRVGSAQSRASQHSQSSFTRGQYLTLKDELGLAAVKALRTQTSVPAIAPQSPSAIINSPVRKTDFSRSFSHHSSIDTLQEVRNISETQTSSSSSKRYMGLALPLDVTLMCEVSSSRDDQDEPLTSLAMKCYSPKSNSKDGLELHTTSNCLFCVYLYDDAVFAVKSNIAEINGDANKLSKMTTSGHAEKKVVGLALQRRECIKFVTTICSSIGVTAAEEGLLRLREQFPDLFQDVCLFSEISAMLSTYSYHLAARRFIQDLFQDTTFQQILDGVENLFLFDKDSPCCEKHKADLQEAEDDSDVIYVNTNFDLT